MSLFSTAPFGDKAGDGLPAYVESLADVPTPWVCAACASLQRDWSENRTPQPGDVRKRASILRERERTNGETADRVKQIAAPRPMSQEMKFDLAAEMRAASERFAALTLDQQEAMRDQWLEDDIARGRLTVKAASNLRACRKRSAYAY